MFVKTTEAQACLHFPHVKSYQDSRRAGRRAWPVVRHALPSCIDSVGEHGRNTAVRQHVPSRTPEARQRAERRSNDAQRRRNLRAASAMTFRDRLSLGRDDYGPRRACKPSGKEGCFRHCLAPTSRCADDASRLAGHRRRADVTSGRWTGHRLSMPLLVKAEADVPRSVQLRFRRVFGSSVPGIGRCREDGARGGQLLGRRNR